MRPQGEKRQPGVQAAHRSVLLVGRLSHYQRSVVQEAVSATRLQVEYVEDGAEAERWLEQRDAAAVLAPMNQPETETLCLAVRRDPARSSVALLGLAEEVTDLAFAYLYGFGGDDLVPLQSSEPLEYRLRVLPTEPVQADPVPRGKVLVADADDRKRLLRARVLHNAGFEVCFAAETKELEEAACAEGLALVAVDVERESLGALETLSRLRAEGNQVPWVVAAEPRRVGDVTARVQALGRVVVYDSFAPLENVMFLANEALHSASTEKRASSRLLYGATVGFRVAGRDRDEYGYAYNISAEGLYVRTLAPLAPGEEAWIELKPPRTDRRVRLEARVAWRRQFGPVHGFTVPPGFGLFLTGGSVSDLQRYRQGYEAFARDFAARGSNSPGKGLTS